MVPRKKPGPPWSPPKQFDEYRLLWQIGRGGMGEVYLGHDTLLDRPVAIKFISAIEPDALMREQFLTEARAAARLQHPNVVTIYRVGEIDGRPYIISEFVRGQNLDHIKLPLPWGRALEMGIELSRGLAAAHRRGVLHRDIKPGNVILAADGGVKLLDFGLAKFVEAAVIPELLAENVQISGLEMTAPTLDIKVAAKTPEKPVKLFPSAASKEDAEHEEEDGNKKVPPAKKPAGAGEDFAYEDTGERPFSPPIVVSPEVVRSTLDGSVLAPMEIAGRGSAMRRTSGIKGTPLYMAPEVLNGEPASRRSDIYSLGALLYELCVGSPPHYDPLASLETLRETATNTDAAPLAQLVPNIEPRLAAVIERCLRRKPNERYASGEELRDALEQLADNAKKDEIPAGNPYRGLLPFEAEHRALFFGRKSEIGTLVDRLRTEPFILVAADSGVGKSSLCRAGVLPLVADGALGSNRTWSQATLVPGRRPLSSLVTALCSVLGGDEDQLATELRQDPSQLARLIHRQLDDQRGLIIFLDQMEELVTIGEPEESGIVGEALAALTSRAGNVRLLATVRSDFLARLASVPGIGEEISRALYILRPLSHDKIREVIVGPAHKKGVSFESEALVNHIVKSTATTDGGLPLLQFALAELWEVKTGDLITAEALESIGGVEGALARHADHVIGRLPPEQRILSRRILMSLVTLEGTRARRSEEELLRDGVAARAVLEALVRGRLLVARDTPEGPAYEVAHEALIKGWHTLRTWLEDHAESRAVKQRLETAALDWQRLGRSKEVLWSGRQIAETALLEPTDIGPREEAFLAASRQAAARRRKLRQMVLLSLPVLLVLLYSAVRVLAARDLDRRIISQLSEGERLNAAAQAKAVEVGKMRQQAFLLFDQMKREPGEELWAKARKEEEGVDRLYGEAAGKLEAALSLDTKRDEVRSLLADVIYARALGAEQDHAEAMLRDLLQRLSLYDANGARQRRWNAPGHVKIESEPSAARVFLAKYVEDEHGKRRLQESRELGLTPLTNQDIERGSYLLTLRAPGRVEVKYPILLGRDERLSLQIPLPEEQAVPAGFVYIAAGYFLFGAGGEETLRQKFFNTVPQHKVFSDAYLIAAHETTFGEYIEFLNTLTPELQEVHRPKVAAGGVSQSGMMELKAVDIGRWQLSFQPMTVLHTAVSGQAIVYQGRAKHATQDWLRFPVGGVSRSDGEAYAAWLARTGRLPGARLCNELEWERAARGADDREYPSGNTLDPDEANFDQTYGRKAETEGPDEVGSHPESRSPFGVDDLAGNCEEALVSSLSPDETSLRGGGFPWDSLSCRSINRNAADANFRLADSGFRICATWPIKADVVVPPPSPK